MLVWAKLCEMNHLNHQKTRWENYTGLKRGRNRAVLWTLIDLRWLTYTHRIAFEKQWTSNMIIYLLSECEIILGSPLLKNKKELKVSKAMAPNDELWIRLILCFINHPVSCQCIMPSLYCVCIWIEGETQCTDRKCPEGKSAVCYIGLYIVYSIKLTYMTPEFCVFWKLWFLVQDDSLGFIHLPLLKSSAEQQVGKYWK